MLNHHQRRVRHIDANLDHRGADQHRHHALGEQAHHGLFLGHRHARMQQADAHAGQCCAQIFMRLRGVHQIDGLAFLNQRANPVDLPAFGNLRLNAGHDLVAPRIVDDLGDDGRAAGRQFVER